MTSSQGSAPAFSSACAFILRDRIAWRHPQWWSAAVSAVAWAILLTLSVQGAGRDAAPHGHDDATLLSHMVNWSLMVIAMMVPLTFDAIRTTAARSLWRRRHRSIAAFLVGYVFPWFAIGLLASFVAAGLQTGGERSVTFAMPGLVFAAGWQLTPFKQTALTACHRTIPLAPYGWRATRDCIRYGWLVGGRCVVSCGALMAACVLARHAVPIMICASVVAAAERYDRRVGKRLTCAALLLTAGMYAAL